MWEQDRENRIYVAIALGPEDKASVPPQEKVDGKLTNPHTQHLLSDSGNSPYEPL